MQLARRVPVPTMQPVVIFRTPIVHVAADVYFVGWTEGTHSTGRVFGRFVDLR